MSTAKTKARWVAAALFSAALLAGSVSVAGCGGGSVGDTFLPAGQVAVQYEGDDSISRDDPSLMGASMTTARNAYELVVARGGSYRAELFSGGIATVALTSPVEIPPPDSARDDLARSDVVPAARAELQAGIDQVLAGSSEQPGGLRAGSSVADNLREALERAQASQSGGAHPVVVEATDGVDTDVLKPYLDEDERSLARRISSRLGTGGGEGVTVLIAGVGLTTQASDGERARRLRAAWLSACRATGADCAVSSDLEPPQLEEALADA